MPMFKITDSIAPTVLKKVDPEYRMYQLLTTKDKRSWVTIKPTAKELEGKSWYKQFTFYDPNELNKKCGLPPHYLIVKRKGGKLEDWVKENFVDVKLHENSLDFCFEGTYKEHS